jgi:hypothetical protein
MDNSNNSYSVVEIATAQPQPEQNISSSSQAAQDAAAADTPQASQPENSSNSRRKIYELTEDEPAAAPVEGLPLSPVVLPVVFGSAIAGFALTYLGFRRRLGTLQLPPRLAWLLGDDDDRRERAAEDGSGSRSRQPQTAQTANTGRMTGWVTSSVARAVYR